MPGAEPLDWYKDAVIYQLHVKAYRDSNGDGIGDFPGLTSKLDYIQSLGATAIWLLPFYPSPLKDDGYDIADYSSIHPWYGSLADFQAFLRAAHARGLKVITELVLNHTSDRHPWFERARRAPPGSPTRNFYVWSDTTDRYKDARVIFKDYETSNWTWDPVAGAYYWHRFFSHQPDLNFHSPAVRESVFGIMDHWLGMGVDGFRLDAIPYLFERDGTSCESLPETHAFLREIRRYVDAKYKGRVLIAEANQAPAEACNYFGAGDECHMAFHFPLMPKLYLALALEDRSPITGVLAETPTASDTTQWALYLRNHDDLGLDVLSEGERSLMTRVYAPDSRMRLNAGIRRRFAPLLSNDRRQMELLNSLLLSLPGTPVIYYGDELGMGDNVWLDDRHGLRTPMQWSSDRNAGFSSANPQQLYLPLINDPEYHHRTINVEVQERNPSSLLNSLRDMIAVRKRFSAFGRGDLEVLSTPSSRVLAYIRRVRGEQILAIANLSRAPQPVELDLSRYAGRTPVELFGSTPFPRIREAPYVLSLGPHQFLWFALNG